MPGAGNKGPIVNKVGSSRAGANHSAGGGASSGGGAGNVNRAAALYASANRPGISDPYDIINAVLDFITGTKPAERRLMSKYGIGNALTGMSLSQEAKKLSERLYGGGNGMPDDGANGNAFQHAYWTALMSYTLGYEQSVAWGIAHETYEEGTDMNADQGDGFTLQDHVNMDLHNNQIGALIGQRAPGPGQVDHALLEIFGSERNVTIAEETYGVSGIRLYLAIAVQNALAPGQTMLGTENLTYIVR